MNYEKKYKEALERAREQYNKRTPLYDIESIFPELKESKDERIRKELIEHIKANKEADYVLFKKFSPDDVIAWLVANICDFEYYVKLFKKDFGL